MLNGFENKFLYDNKIKVWQNEKCMNQRSPQFYLCPSQLTVFSFYVSENHMPFMLTIWQSESTCLNHTSKWKISVAELVLAPHKNVLCGFKILQINSFVVCPLSVEIFWLMLLHKVLLITAIPPLFSCILSSIACNIFTIIKNLQ